VCADGRACAPTDDILGDIALVRTADDTTTTAVFSYDATGDKLLRLFPPLEARYSSCDFQIHGSWLYSQCRNVSAYSLERSPAKVARVPQDVLPLGVLSQLAEYAGENTHVAWTVGSTNVYWTASTSEPMLQYLFRAPLPPQPCDEELACDKADEVCGEAGLCEG
jgi:hypothetical protein